MTLRRRLSLVPLTTAWAATRRSQVKRFHAAARDPARAQAAWLHRFLTGNAGTAFARAHKLDAVRDVEGFRRAVPVADWTAMRPWVERVEAGEPHVLTREPVLALERTSGTTTGVKHVPLTRGLLDDFGAATGPWLDDLFLTFPSLFASRQYWSLSPAARPPSLTSGGLKVGLEDDTEYFGPATRWALRRLMAVDASVGRLSDMEAWREATLRQLVACEDLGFFSVWNPSFLTLLLDALEARWMHFEDALPPARREAIRRRLDAHGRLTAEAVWPHLKLVSCWTDAFAAQALPALRRWFPTTPVQGKGLLATEGVVSFPLWGVSAPVAAVSSHFLEFEDLNGSPKQTKLVHELAAGAEYAPVLTTRGGFVRYRLADRVRCVGHWQRAPLLRFFGRLDRVVDLRGEKLDAGRAERAVAAALHGRTVDFALLAPRLEPRAGYVLYLESPLPDAELHKVAAEVEAVLRQDFHYDYCRDLGQLEAVAAVRVRDGARRRLEALAERGVRLGNIKPSAFDPDAGWDAVFQTPVNA